MGKEYLLSSWASDFICVPVCVCVCVVLGVRSGPLCSLGSLGLLARSWDRLAAHVYIVRRAEARPSQRRRSHIWSLGVATLCLLSPPRSRTEIPQSVCERESEDGPGSPRGLSVIRYYLRSRASHEK